MPGAIYLCTLYCEAECRHHLPCEVWSRAPHPTDRGYPLHFAADGEMAHEWRGKAGKCKVTIMEPEEDEEPDG
jgi:hypothetical protein